MANRHERILIQERNILLYSTLWPRLLGVPFGVLDFQDSFLADELVQFGYLDIRLNVLGQHAFFLTDRGRNVAVETARELPRHTIAFFDDLAKRFEQDRHRGIPHAIDGKIYMDWRPIGSPPFRMQPLRNGRILCSDVQEIIQKYEISVSNVTGNILKPNARKLFRVYYSAAQDGFLLLKFVRTSSLDEFSENYRAEVINALPLPLANQISQDKRPLSNMIQASEEVYSVISPIVKESFNLSLTDHWIWQLIQATESELVYLFSRTTQTAVQHLRCANDIYILQSDLRSAKNRAIAARITDSKLMLRMRCLKSYLSRSYPLSIPRHNRLFQLDPRRLLRHEPMPIDMPEWRQTNDMAAAEAAGEMPDGTDGGAGSSRSGDDKSQKPASAARDAEKSSSSSEQSVVNQPAVMQTSIPETLPEALRILDGLLTNRNNILRAQPANRNKVKIINMAPCDDSEAKGRERISDRARDDRRAAFVFRQIFFRRIELTKTRLDNFTVLREKTVHRDVLRNAIAIFAISMFGAALSFPGFRDFALTPLCELLHELVKIAFGIYLYSPTVAMQNANNDEGYSRQSPLITYVGAFFMMFGFYYAYRVQDWFYKYEMIPVVDALRSMKTYIAYGRVFSICLRRRWVETVLANREATPSNVRAIEEDSVCVDDARAIEDDSAGVDFAAVETMIEQRLQGVTRKIDRYRHFLTVLISMLVIMLAVVALLPERPNFSPITKKSTIRLHDALD